MSGQLGLVLGSAAWSGLAPALAGVGAGLGPGPGPGRGLRSRFWVRAGAGAPTESVHALCPGAVRHAHRCGNAEGRMGDLGGQRQPVRRSMGVPFTALPVLAQSATGGSGARPGVSPAHGHAGGSGAVTAICGRGCLGLLSGRRLTVHSSQACRQEGGAVLFPDRPVLPRGFVLHGPPNLGRAQGPAPRCETARRANLRSGTVHMRRCGVWPGGVGTGGSGL